MIVDRRKTGMLTSSLFVCGNAKYRWMTELESEVKNGRKKES